MPFKPDERQYRALTVLQTAQRADRYFDTDYYVEGYAMKYAPYLLYEDDDGPIYEEYLPSAFDNTDMSDVIMQYDHEGRVFARTPDSLRIIFDDVGMFTAADLGKSTGAKQLYEEISAGLIRKMSWCFRVGECHYDDQRRTIVHTAVKKIYDVSAVSIPANDNTVINARKWGEGVILPALQELREKREREIKLLQLKIKLKGS